MMRKMLVLSALLFSVSAHAKLLFEGYLKIESKGKHIGYVIQRDEVDDATKQRTVTYLMWKMQNGHVIQDGVQVVAAPSNPPALYKPVRYTNWMWSGSDFSLTTGTAANGEMSVTRKDVTTGEEIEKGKMPIPADSVFSSMAIQTWAEADPSNFAPGKKTSYVALSEEDNKYDTAELSMLEAKTFAGVKVSQIVSEMLSDTIEIFATPDGQSLGSREAYSDVIAYLVNRRDDAIGDFDLEKQLGDAPSKAADTIRKVFGGDVPRGLRNAVSDTQGKLNAKDAIESFLSPRARKNLPKKKH